VFDQHGFNLNAKLDIDPDFLKTDEHHDHKHGHDHDHHDHAHDEHCDHPSHQHDHQHGHEAASKPKHGQAGHVHDEHCGHDHGADGQHLHHHHIDDDVKSFVFRAKRALDPAKLEDFLGAIVNIYGPKMLRYKGVLNMKGTERKVIFQGVHQLMGSDLGPVWGKDEERNSKMVFIGIDLPKDILLQGLENCYA
jgi:G3E family GTPase